MVELLWVCQLQVILHAGGVSDSWGGGGGGGGGDERGDGKVREKEGDVG